MQMQDELTQDDLDLLGEFLISDQTAEDCMTLSVLDGYLTAIAIGPELIMPSEWLGQIWGSHAPQWVLPEEAEGIIEIIMERYNEILLTVRLGAEFFDPIFSINPRDGGIDCQEWAHGFTEGIKLRRAAWEPLFQDRSHNGAIGPIMMQLMDAEQRNALAATEGERVHEMWENAPDFIPVGVVKMDRFWKQARGKSDRKERPGRNDSCPCGSGKKYKKCCGGN